MWRAFNEDHEAYRATLRSFVEQEIVPHTLDWEHAGVVPRELFTKLADLGVLGACTPEEYGGSGLDFWYTVVTVQELVRCKSVGVAVAVLAHMEFATKTILAAGTPELKEKYLARAARGEVIGALGVTEPNAGSDVASLQTKAAAVGDDYVINGAKTFITNGTIADFVVTAVRTGGEGYPGISLVVVPTDTPGFTVARRLDKVRALASDTAELIFEDCRVPRTHLLGMEGGGFPLIMEGFEGERLVLAVIACTQYRLMLDEAARYGHERETFGRPLLGYQVWQHRLADVLTTIEAAEALTERAIEMYVAGEPCNAEISMAKLFTAGIGMKIAEECSQIFGGYSLMEEYPIARLARDSMGFGIGAGTSEMMREIIARSKGFVAERKRS